ncbi:hypothetical protein AS189_11625 [Arthrobacter alpinus]|uniref:DUF3841 domain-containing protein n=1 Tax=Arthrobacter alpinus TaxID=656366 RepID=A0A0S2M087_9MICC|nr:DUF3841 domain-containing protein [Arthrobacter alpinus]ALO67025.1 hypothetical protein AS189_11625 [Arthrobacter alpinus]
MHFPIRTSPSAHAVPKGRIPYAIQAPVLLLHTVQSEAAFDELCSTGRIVPNPALAAPTKEDAYSWLYRQMNKRLPTRGDGALWFWAKIRRPDLISQCGWADGDVLLTCHIPREHVLLSQYDDWHQVLNHCPVAAPRPHENDDAYRKRFDDQLDDFFGRVSAAGQWGNRVSDWPENFQHEIEMTWEQIMEPANYPKTVYWRATTHELRAENVTEAVHLKK